MKECPFINECDEKVSESHFKTYCRTKIGFIINYKDCPFYLRLLREKCKKQKPREWKEEVEQK